MTTTKNYEIGGYSVSMTEAQAARWNAGETSEYDLRTVKVWVPHEGNNADAISLRRATSEWLSPETAEFMTGAAANCI